MLANILLLYTPRPLGMGSKDCFLSENSIVVYQIKRTQGENIMLANILPLNTSFITGDWSNILTLFLKDVLLHVNVKGKNCRTTCNKALKNLHTPDVLPWLKC